MKHIKRHHNDDNTQYICNVCGKQSPNKSALYTHQKKVHFTERMHKCAICDKAFKDEKTLKEHMASHTGERLYACEFCQKTCNSSATMHAHRKKMHPVEWEEERLRKSWVA